MGYSTKRARHVCKVRVSQSKLAAILSRLTMASKVSAFHMGQVENVRVKCHVEDEEADKAAADYFGDVTVTEAFAVGVAEEVMEIAGFP